MSITKIFYDFEATSVSRDADPISVGLIAVTEEVNYDLIVIPDTNGMEYYNTKTGITTKNNRENEIKTFYAEFSDFDRNKCDDWVKENVIAHLFCANRKSIHDSADFAPIPVRHGDTEYISHYLKQWLSQFESIEFWSDYDTIDKPMLVDLIADFNVNTLEHKMMYRDEFVGMGYKTSKIGLPKHLPNIKYYDFYDIHTLFKIKGIDPTIDRVEFSKSKEHLLPVAITDYAFTHNALYDAYVSYLCYEKLNKM